jgi:D-glycero-alpha-D-manno-heptose-7-phosphate kinase
MRIDFAGGWSDVPAFADREGGAVTAAAIDLAVEVECYEGGGKIKLAAEDLGARLTLQSAKAIVYDGTLDLHKAALNMLPVTGGVEVISRSDAPVGSGLGGSGALDVALLAAFASCRRERFSTDDLAELGFHLETRELGLAGGRQDQLSAALGGFHAFGFSENGVIIRALHLDERRRRELERHVVLVYTGQSHFSSGTHDQVWAAYDAGDARVTSALRGMRALASEAAAALLEADWRALASVMDENWSQQQKLHPTIATPRMRRIEEVARAAGAWGAKATGAGAGGCMVFLAPPEARMGVVGAVDAAGARVLDVGFAESGVTVSVEEDDVLVGS